MRTVWAVQLRYRVLTAVVTALGMTATLAGCGGGTGGTGEVTLKLVAADYGTGPANTSRKFWDGLVKGFEASHPGIKVDVTVHSWKDIDREVAAMVKKGQAPDIAQIGSYADYAKAGKLYRADQMVSIRTQANFLPSLAEAGSLNSTQYGLPFVASTRLLFYNKKVFAQAGLDAPRTWNDIRDDAAALGQRGVTYPFALPLGPEESQAEAMMWLLGGGGGYIDDSGSYEIDSAENVRTFDWLKTNLVDKGLVGPTAPGKLDRQKAFDAFTDGRVGMLNGHPTLMQEAERKGVSVGMVPMPGINGPGRSSLGVADWIMGFKQNGHRVQLGKFFDYLFTDRNVIDFADEYDLLPVTDSASAAMESDTRYKPLWKFLDALPDSQFYPYGKTSWARSSESIKENIGKAVEPNGSPASVLGRIARDSAAAARAD
ncbi:MULTISPECIES: extracellular solute-binding protein [unclassified Streptomyces]|jgi:multiple sugar transport system substrate-binding protein|uniref:ABC transporter substrate-binding protein n=1 Tax=unclassified Streptomyces TaxID=2593676 RepID=UPI00081B7073|nr:MULTISPECIES: extracellular solute-binding protein [unclassified Streptomyces]MEE1749803.1 extracellular solute-binding protein [Streptomyces sp. JV184]MYQ83714.1 extracellular solute-binding protein [Streptomyces sp. SID4936]SCD71882.1 carbohydrate ABC transporter substrate-binding protein, CUT1 family [Streptomyces sp. DvalAA-43]